MVGGAALWLLLASFSSPAAGEELSTIHLTLDGIGSGKGPVIVLLFRRSGWLDQERAVRRLMLPVKGRGELTCDIRGIPYPASYAIEVFHDLNGNGHPDMHWFPLPGPDEPVAFSNNYTPFARPLFDRAAFRLDRKDLDLRISLLRPG